MCMLTWPKKHAPMTSPKDRLADTTRAHPLPLAAQRLSLARRVRRRRRAVFASDPGLLRRVSPPPLCRDLLRGANPENRCVLVSYVRVESSVARRGCMQMLSGITDLASACDSRRRCGDGMPSVPPPPPCWPQTADLRVGGGGWNLALQGL